MLTLDHLIIRSATPEETLAQLAGRAGAPVLTEVEEVRGMASGIVRAGAVDIEVLRLGADLAERPNGYGLGFVADRPLDEAIAELRSLGFGTSVAPRVTAGSGAERRSWRATQVHGLLPDPFPVPVSTKRPGFADRVGEALAGAMTRIPALARAATRRAGGSMVVVTEYGFDVDAVRAEAGVGPRVVEVHLGTGGRGEAWGRLPVNGGPQVHLDDAGPAGIRRVVLDGLGASFTLGDVEFAAA
jgi:hypothetical protein